MTIYTYLIKSLKNQTFYTGISYQPLTRLKEHNAGKLKITSKKRPYQIIYIKEHNSYSEARKHEKWLKKKDRRYKNMLAQLAPPYEGGVK